MHHAKATASTNDDAFQALNTSSCVLVWSLDQQSGRGSRGRSWTTPPGCGLAFSLGFTEDTGPLPNDFCYPLFAGLVWFNALSQLGLRRDLRLKWPNDVLWRGRKLAGILCESRWRKNDVRMVIGVGTNLKPHPSLAGLPKGYACLRDANTNISHLDLIAAALESFQVCFREYKDDQALTIAWLDKAWIEPGTPVHLKAEGKATKGTFAGLTKSGLLTILGQDGATVTVPPTCTDFEMHPRSPGPTS